MDRLKKKLFQDTQNSLNFICFSDSNFCLHGVCFSGDLNTNVDFFDFIFVKIYSKFDVKKQKKSLNHKKIKII